jgi:hypothetical protein
MIDADFPEALSVFIQENISTTEAAELLVMLSGDPARQWNLQEILHNIRPTVITEGELRKYLLLFQARSLVIEHPGSRFQYQPASAILDSIVRALEKAYNERPVTLIRTIYSRKIRSFADAFKLKND